MVRKQMSGHCRSTVPALIFLVLFCTAAAVAADCPSGCSCLQPAVARENGYDACGGQLTACGYDVSQRTMYCYKTPLSLVARTLQPLSVVTATTTQPGTCPSGCSCMMESEAKEKFGTYSRCSETPCYSVITSSTTLKAYCFRQGVTVTTTTPAPCPSGCNCLSDARAKERYGTYTRCTDTICGYDIPTNVVAAYQIPKYCVKQGTSTPVCPEGCNCISEAIAKDRYGTYTKCTENACGYEQDQTPKYCIKQGTTTPACPEGCSCISEAAAKAKGGTWTRCSADVCGYEQSTATLAAVVQVPKYCMKQQETAPACPDGCTCISDEDAKLKGLTDRCDNSQTPCGYKSAATTANQQIPMYCYKLPVAAPACPDNCGGCMREADAKAKFGPFNYSRCSEKVCGYVQSAAANYAEPEYCFRPTVSVTPVPSVCPEGCSCVTNGTAAEKKLSFCGGKLTSCGYDANRQPLYCYGETATPACAYDYQKNACTGTCQQGYTCSLRALKKDESGKIVYADCGCSGPATTPCSYDPQKNACTGTCRTGTACAIVGRQADDKTGAVTPVCGCPQQSACSYNYDKEACTGTCPATGDTCQVNSLYRDPASGKVIRAECQCKGTGDTCSCDAAKGACTGTCANGQACTITERSDVAGAVVCKTCGCTGGCVLNSGNQCSGTCATGAPCTRNVYKDDSGQEKVSCSCGGSQPGTPSVATTPGQGFLEGFFGFFNKLFGGK